MSNQLDVKNIVNRPPWPLKDFKATVGGKNSKYVKAHATTRTTPSDAKARFTYSNGQSDIQTQYKCEVKR